MINKVIYIMGVSGSGKTTIGEMLSSKTGYPFYDADNFHPQKNITKMASGQPLSDEDRWPWLDNIHSFVEHQLQTNSVIFACSALKESYRKKLSKDIESQCRWVLLNGSYQIIKDRLEHRKGHYMPPSLLKSQFDALEIPGNIIEIDISLSPEKITEEIMEKI